MNTISQVVLIISTAVALAGIAYWLRVIFFMPRLVDPTPESGSSEDGIRYAFTVGMLPWKKESTRKHWKDYARGILFHVGILAALITLAVSPWAGFPVAGRAILGAGLAVGFVSGILGISARFTRPNMRSMSRLDDYLSPALVTAFIVTGLVFVANPSLRAVFYLVSSAMLLYLPFSKIRHFVYFFIARIYFGRLFGHRGVIGLTQAHVVASEGGNLD